MDLAYDQIAADALSKDNDQGTDNKKLEQPQPTLNEEVQEAYKAISTSAWGSRLGGFFGTVVKQVKQHASCSLVTYSGPDIIILHYRASPFTEKHHRNLPPWVLTLPEQAHH